MLKWFTPKEQKNNILQNEPTVENIEGFPESGEIHENRKGFFGRLKERLTKTRETLITRVDRLVLGKKEINEDLLEELEEILITSDLGVMTTQVLIESVQQKVK
jgi:fused signal recognition particle receptor